MNYPDDVKCLPDCDERHAEDCPRLAAEEAYYRWYFGVRTPAFYNFAPAGYERKEED